MTECAACVLNTALNKRFPKTLDLLIHSCQVHYIRYNCMKLDRERIGLKNFKQRSSNKGRYKPAFFSWFWYLTNLRNYLWVSLCSMNFLTAHSFHTLTTTASCDSKALCLSMQISQAHMLELKWLLIIKLTLLLRGARVRVIVSPHWFTEMCVCRHLNRETVSPAALVHTPAVCLQCSSTVSGTPE